MPPLRLLVQLLVGFVGVDVACLHHGYDMRVLVEHFKGDWAVILLFFVLVNCQFNEVFLAEWLASAWINVAVFA